MFTPDICELLHFFHSFTAWGFGFYLLTQFITGKFHAAFGNKRTLALFVCMIFHGISLLLSLYIHSGSSSARLELYSFAFNFIAHIILAGTAISLLGNHLMRILVYCSTTILLTAGAYIFTGNLFLCSLIFLIIPADILYAAAMQHLAMESTDKKERSTFFRLGLFYILYLLIQLPVNMRYLPLVQAKTSVLSLLPMFCLLSFLTLTLLFINYYSLTHSRILPEKRKDRCILYAIIVAFIVVNLNSHLLSMPYSQTYAEFYNQKLEILHRSLKKRIQMLSAHMECIQMEDTNFFSNVNTAPRKELYSNLSMSPFLLNQAGICTHALKNEWIGKNFTPDLLNTPVQKNKIYPVFLKKNRTGSRGLFLIAPRLNNNKGYVCIKLNFPRFEFFSDFNDDCFLISPKGDVLLDRTGKFSGMQFTGVTSKCLSLKDHNGKAVQLPEATAGQNKKTYVFTSMKDIPFLDNSLLILGVDSSKLFSFRKFTLPVSLQFWLLALLLFTLWKIKKAFREKTDLIKVYHDNFCLSSGVPTLIFDEQGIITEANCYAEDLFHVTEGALNGKKFDSLIRSAETDTINDCIQKMYSGSIRELITGYACLPGGEKFCVFIFLVVPAHIAGDKNLYACRFMLRNDAAKVDPVPAGAWMSFCKHAKDPVFLLTADCRIISSNFAERTAVPPVTLEDILTPENAHIFRSMTENVMLSGQVFNFEAVIPAKENVPRFYDILFFPVYTVTGQQHKPVAVGVVARNITNLKQSEKAVSELQQMLRDQQISS